MKDLILEISEKIEKKDYLPAIDSLKTLSSGNDEKSASFANYLLGQVLSLRDCPKHDIELARFYLRKCLNSEYSFPKAFALYPHVENDPNVAINYLNRGLALFPVNSSILCALLQYSSERERVVSMVEENEICDTKLLARVIGHLFSVNQWDRCEKIVLRLLDDTSLDTEEGAYLMLIAGYCELFSQAPDFPQAQAYFEKSIVGDLNNYFHTSHHLGLIYTHLRLGNRKNAENAFDRLLVEHNIRDLDDGPMPLDIYVSFEFIYKALFGYIAEEFRDDSARKLKANTLHSLYLYYPSIYSDVTRYKKHDATVLARYLKQIYNPTVAAALYSMRCSFKQYVEAYEILWIILKNYDNPNDYAYFSEILSNADLGSLIKIAESTANHLRAEDYQLEVFISCIFSSLIEKLHELELCTYIRNISDCLSIDEIATSTSCFECAYAYGEIKSPRAEQLYKTLIQKDPTNSPAINNLAVIYKDEGKLFQALALFEQAISISPSHSRFNNNIQKLHTRIRQELADDINAISERLNIEALEEIGYSRDMLMRLHSIHDTEIKEILLRDFRECAIAVVAGQDKLAAIMCGSIAEAVLMYRITEMGVLRYDLDEKKSDPTACGTKIEQMSLSSLLEVAKRLEILDKDRNYHLGHYIRDYRNMVHPAKEIRMKERISHKTVETMWSLLLQLLSDLFPQ